VGKELKDKLKIRTGIEVMSVGEGKMKDAGIRKGFVITHVNQNPYRVFRNWLHPFTGTREGP
jgi:hypothetical protein